VIGLLQSPAKRVISALNAGGKLASLVKALEDRADLFERFEPRNFFKTPCSRVKWEQFINLSAGVLKGYEGGY
jgi:hypothetical protein